MSEYVLLASRVLTGLLAGLFFAFAVGVMPALRAMDDDTFVAVMRRINLVIVNPVFLVVFFGAALAPLALLAWQADGAAVAGAVLAAATLGITVALNIPLNNALATGGARASFESSWVRWNLARTLTGTGSFVCLLLV